MAEAARQQLLAMAADQRRPSDYRTVMDVYRLVYHNNPADVHAPDAIYQVGELLESWAMQRAPHSDSVPDSIFAPLADDEFQASLPGGDMLH